MMRNTRMRTTSGVMMRAKARLRILSGFSFKLLPLFLLASTLCLTGADARLPGNGEQTELARELPDRLPAVYDVREYGAKGDGETLDTKAINDAITAAAAAGGGTVYFPAGTYLSFSIHLRSDVGLYLEHGAVLLAADPAEHPGGYDPAEPNAWGDEHEYQDFGHSHWHNSLMWGEEIENVSILGPGLIDGSSLWKGLGRAHERAGNKAIALKLARNVTIRDITIYQGGHFGILASGVDNLTIDNIKIDTNRDGIDIDACRNVRISNVSINSPNDDAIVLKSSYALGFPRVTENVTITNSLVSGYDIGSLLDATYKRTVERAPDRDGPTGRIKFGTESNGGFKNITISNVVFDRSRGLALETVDGGLIEDVSISNITMRDVSNAPIFLRLGSRMRGPEGTPIGAIRRVHISDVVVYDADARYASIITGIPGHRIEDVTLSNIRIVHRGGLSLEEVARQPAELVNTFFFRGEGGPQPREPFATPEREADYPEPSMFGLIPAHGLFVRHVDGLTVHNLSVSYMEEDLRPAFVLEDVQDADFYHVEAEHAPGVPVFVLQDVEDFRVTDSPSVPDAARERIEREEL